MLFKALPLVGLIYTGELMHMHLPPVLYPWNPAKTLLGEFLLALTDVSPILLMLSPC